MASRDPGLPSDEIVRLVERLLEGEPDYRAERRERGLCCYCRAGLGREAAPARLFAVVADGGLLLRLSGDRRKNAVDRGVAIPNAALPEWVLRPIDAPGGVGREPQDPDLHGAPQEWVWLPVPDVEAFERRRGHLLEALAYGRYLATLRENEA